MKVMNQKWALEGLTADVIECTVKNLLTMKQKEQ